MEATPLHFGVFELYPDTGELRREGRPVALGQRAGALLRILLQANGRVVSKRDLMRAAWPNVFVEEGNLSVQIAALRKLLGNGQDDPNFIITVPGVGYRLVTPQEAPASDTPALPAVAVLPLHRQRDDRKQDWFADGVATEIITALARFRSFTVVSRNSSFAYKDRNLDVREVAAALGAEYVLEGSLQRAGGRLRIYTQLVEGKRGVSLWAEQFEGAIGDVFDFQDRITACIATLVEPAIESAEIARSRRERPGSIAVYDLYLRALSLLNDESIRGNAAAYALLDRALRIDPDNPVLLAHAAWALEHRSTMGWPPIGPDDAGRCVAMARRGLAHSGGDPRLMAQCGMALLQTGRDYDGGMHVIRAAVAANPNDLFVTAAAAVATMHCGDMDEALGHIDRGIWLAPRDPDLRFLLTARAMIAIIHGQYEEALVSASRSLALNSSFDATYWMLIAANAFLGRMAEARSKLDRLLVLAPGVCLSRIRAGQPAKHPERIGIVLDGLRRAGMPEG